MSEKHKMTREAEQSGHYLRKVMDGSPVGMMVFAEDDRIVYANSRAEILFGRKLAETKPVYCGDFIGCAKRHTDPRGCGHTPACPTCLLFRAIRASFSSPSSDNELEGDVMVEREAGFDLIFLKYKVGTVSLDEGAYAVVAVDDITTQKRAEEALRESESHLREAQSMARLGRWTLELPRQRLQWSDTIFDIFEIDPNEFEASYEAFLNAIHPDDRERVDRAFSESLRSGKPYEVEHRLRMKDGRVKWLHEACRTEYDGNGKAVRCVGIVQDITDRKRAEEALRSSEEFQRAMIATSPMAIFSIDLAGRVATWNASAEKMFGWTSEEIVGRPLPIVPEGKKDEFAELRKILMEGGSFSNLELVRQKKDGALFDCRLSTAPIFNDAGGIVGIMGIMEDITDPKRTEEELRRSEEKFRTTLNSIGDAVISTDRESRVDYLNPMAEILTGWNEQGAHGKPLDEVFRIVNEETRETVENPAVKVLREGIVVGLANHTLLIAKDGKELPIADSGAPIRDEKGETAGVVLVFRDQTEEREHQRRILANERRYRALFTSIRDAILVADTERNITDCNAAFCGLFGYAREEIIGRKTITVYENEEEFKELGRRLKEHMGDSDFLYTVHYRKKNGTVFPGETKVFYLRDDDGAITGFIGLIRDITARRKAEKILEEQLEEMQRWHDVTLERENRVLELKREVNQVLIDAGREPRYASAVSDAVEENERTDLNKLEAD
ncbi:MAG: PAS domain S-box protein [Deltaproteobacteria bacterium]|nr:PAS domain S-box protein [Deltaproteobacteria bacterium]